MKENISFSFLNQVDSDKVASVVAVTRAIFLSPRTAFVTSSFSSKSMCAKKCLQFSTKYVYHMFHRDHPRFFDQVGHQTTNASIGNT